ncbi:hypothetical protein BC358_07030 [Hydrogenophaga sp. H7]|nr:hypothetical protein BC358_07030 [Hydrogenophaga sp. H7]
MSAIPRPVDRAPSTPWWKVPHMWMVVGGPLLVIVAGLVTVVIAVKNPDPVLNKSDYERDLAAAQRLEGQAKVDAMAKLQPAHQARNHAASPVVPAAPSK